MVDGDGAWFHLARLQLHEDLRPVSSLTLMAGECLWQRAAFAATFLDVGCCTWRRFTVLTHAVRKQAVTAINAPRQQPPIHQRESNLQQQQQKRQQLYVHGTKT